MVCGKNGMRNTLMLAILVSMASIEVSGSAVDRTENDEASNPIIDIYQQSMKQWSDSMFSTINFIQKCLSGITDVMNSIHVMEQQMKQLGHFMDPSFPQKVLLTATLKDKDMGTCVNERVEKIEKVIATVEKDMQKCVNEKFGEIRDEIQTFSKNIDAQKSNVFESVDLFQRCTKENVATEAQLMECIKESSAITFPKISQVVQNQLGDMKNLDFHCIFTIATEQRKKLFEVLDELKICYGI